MIWWMLFGCGSPEAPPPPVRFVRGGRWDGSRLDATPWQPGERIGERVAPRLAECVALGHVRLGDISARIAAGIPAPDTAMAFSPDGRWLAIGGYNGELMVVDGWTAQVRTQRTLAGAMVKRVAWSPDGRTLYAAEQSVDAFLHALDPADLRSRARFRAADVLGDGRPPGADDPYGVYALPGAYGLELLPGGDVLLVGAHGWSDAAGRKNRSAVWRLRDVGDRFEVVARWPEAPADATFLATALDDERVAVAVSRSSDGPDPEGLPIGGVAVLDHDLQPIGQAQPPPLRPFYDRAFVWEAIALGPGPLTLGLTDGRVWRPDRVRELGTPVDADGVPIAATIGHLTGAGDTLYVSTSTTSIPYGAASPETRPPEAHPNENRLWALDRDSLTTRWTWHGGEALAGITLGGRWLVVGVHDRGGQPDRHGVIVFDTAAQGDGAEHLATSCSTGQPVFFRAAVAADGRVAVASYPEKVEEAVRGDYRVTIFL